MGECGRYCFSNKEDIGVHGRQVAPRGRSEGRQHMESLSRVERLTAASGDGILRGVTETCSTALVGRMLYE
ncbi:unnamed protein product, partial [Iphiclides podalirius]